MSDNLWAYGRAQHTPRTVRAGHCTWTDPDGEGNYDTECGNQFVIIQGTPSENEMVWCCYCGRAIKEDSGNVSPTLDMPATSKLANNLGVDY